jgi:hypothetical protein
VNNTADKKQPLPLSFHTSSNQNIIVSANKKSQTRNIMKKILFVLAIAAALFVTSSVTNEASAQVVTTAALAAGDTATNADTVYKTFSTVEDGIVCFQAKVTKISGTVAGHVILQGTVDGTNWQNVNTDTLTLTDVATQIKIWPVDHGYYKGYRVRIITSGTQASVITFARLRRYEF